MIVACAWAGAPIHRNDRHRSIPLALFQCLFAVPGTEWLAFTGDAVDEMPDNVQIVHLSPMDWESTRQVLVGVDAVVSCDTGLAHLAGAMGIPCAVLLSADCDPRWGMDDTTVWYPSWRLFRQAKVNEWGPVLDQAAAWIASFKWRKAA